MSLSELLLVVTALPIVGASAYLLVLSLLARRSTTPSAVTPDIRFDIVVPAHNEEGAIAETVQSLLAVDYPAELFRVLVVADNCTDDTAPRAAAAGARVIVRQDRHRLGKGYALADAFAKCLADGLAGALIVVDADTVVSRNLLSAFAVRFAAGANVVQADYGVRNPLASWRTRLMTIALSAFHGIRSLARERLGLSCGLRGNGMGFSMAVLEHQPPAAFSIVEDLEYGIQLGLAGIRVHYVHEARVLGYMAATEQAARSQRQRWERGRTALARRHVPELIRQAWLKRDWCLLDLAIDLSVPPLGFLAGVSAAGFAVSLLVASTYGLAQALWAVSLLGIGVHVWRAWRISGVGLYGLVDLAWAPVYIIWKLTLRCRDRGAVPQEWVRTSREARP